MTVAEPLTQDEIDAVFAEFGLAAEAERRDLLRRLGVDETPTVPKHQVGIVITPDSGLEAPTSAPPTDG
jgi:hypothetical protein